VAGSAAANGLSSRIGRVESDEQGLRAASIWVAVTAGSDRLDDLAAGVWSVPDRTVEWTDDHSNILEVLRRDQG